LAEWVEELRTVLYRKGGRKLVARLQELRQSIACRGPGTKRKREVLDRLIGYLEPRRKMMRYPKWMKEDLVIATGVIEGAVRYVIGERMDCSGMRWIEERAEAILHLRCIEVNGLWDEWHEVKPHSPYFPAVFATRPEVSSLTDTTWADASAPEAPTDPDEPGSPATSASPGRAGFGPTTAPRPRN
jgi:hypothetical protein